MSAELHEHDDNVGNSDAIPNQERSAIVAWLRREVAGVVAGYDLGEEQEAAVRLVGLIADNIEAGAHREDGEDMPRASVEAGSNDHNLGGDRKVQTVSSGADGLGNGLTDETCSEGSTPSRGATTKIKGE